MTGFLIFVVLIVAAFFILAPRPYRAPLTTAYQQVKPLSDVEQVLYWRLVEALPECVVLSQVTFSRFMKPTAHPRQRDYFALYGRIAQKSIDYLVCLKDFTVVAAVELDDSSHVVERDRQRDELLRSAGITVLRVHARELPSVDRIRAAFTT